MGGGGRRSGKGSLLQGGQVITGEGQEQAGEFMNMGGADNTK